MRDCKMWFGTLDYATWITPPLAGADSSPQSWSADGTDLNGGGWVTGSYNSHRLYQYAWAGTSTQADAQLMRSFADGTFGRGKLYFQEPNIYHTNVLPARWADPSITTDYEGPQLVPGVDPSRTATSGFQKYRLPVRSAIFNMQNATPIPVVGAIELDDTNSVFIPIPEGKQLNIGAFYSADTYFTGVYVSKISWGGTVSGAPGASIRLPHMTNDGVPDMSMPGASPMFPVVMGAEPGIAGVRVWLGRFDTLDPRASVTVAGIHARISNAGEAPGGEPFWLGGQGHSGAKIVGKPTYVTRNGIGGGQIEYAATFREVTA